MPGVIYTLEDYGKAYTSQIIVPGNTATGIATDVLTYVERSAAYTSGGTTEIKAGDWIVGASSASRAIVVSVTLVTGTWAGGDAAGIMRIRSQSAAFTAGENVGVGASADLATITTAFKEDQQSNYDNKYAKVRNVFVSVLTNNALVNIDGSTPDQTALNGLTIGSGGSISINEEQAKNFKVIDRVSGSACRVHVIGYF